MSGSSSTHENMAAPICNCEEKCVIFISKTPKNPNRRFFGCPYFNFQEKMLYCDYFMWEDEFIASQVELHETKKERDVMNSDVEVKVNQFESDMEHKINVLERDIEVMKFQSESQGKRGKWKKYVGIVVLLIVALVIAFCIWKHTNLFK
ncbi:uncharacterized protein At4g04775-like [Vicia villosa]|uniref:uncharacterized protein At4g04775-like n=1 Tax=Vicia villosa TaxID=3911 RepID=UPI00273BEC54|nr:uncharacterized protein At4g04775-like [Vicia villosa]